MKKLLLGLGVLSVLGMVASVAQAMPTREEAYRSDRLNIVIYKDGQDPNVFWYLPPVKLYENDGKVVSYRRPKGDKVNYYFYIVPYMTDELMDMLAGEVPNLQNKTQLKPVVARQFGIQVKQFDTVVMGDKITDYHYLNQPQLIQFSLNASTAADFDFFLKNKPGIQANVLFDYEAERVDKYLTIELSYKEIYDALNIGVTGKYVFAKAEISKGVENYLAKKYMNVKSKGDIPFPEVINKVIEECFTPFQKKDDRKNEPRWPYGIVNPMTKEAASRAWQLQESMRGALEIGGWEPGDPTEYPPSPSSGGTSSGSDPSDGSSAGLPGGRDGSGIQFTFKKELAKSTKTFYYNQQHLTDSGEIAAVPLYLTLQRSGTKVGVKVAPLQKRDFVVEAANEQGKPLSTGIKVGIDEQYIINAVFAYSASSAYEREKRWYRWSPTWPSIDGDLYYRVGTSPWNKVNGRALVKIENIYHGELQFYLDRKSIWEKIPAEFKSPKMLGTIPAIFTYKYTYPQFNVVVTGRQVTVSK